MSSSDEPKTAAGEAAGRDAPAPPVSRSLSAARMRDNVARVVWIVCMSLALVLAVAAFTYALEANEDNGLVKLVRDLADVFDLSFFDLDNPVKAFEGKNAGVKTALFNYGLASVVYLVIGRALERVIRP
ncbi:hypothetical protein [Nocardioides daeguensis]|uniref:Uncharacterized protein n=1 Tax=Nocardioides daeguensis TaxID=908359 RepID=A0ABP6VPH8_9ACTN|nr:hypothetical protein [Nocardioides daeguensis]